MENTEKNSLETEADFTGKGACFLEDDDIQCGHVAYNAQSRVLKFTCTYCDKTYDNIEYFCQHLGEHINTFPDEHEDETIHSQEEEEEFNGPNCVNLEAFAEKLIVNASTSFVGDKTVTECDNLDYLQNIEDSICTQSGYKTNSCDIDEALEDTADNHSNFSDMIIEEIEEDIYDSAADNAQDSRQLLQKNDNFEILGDECCSEYERSDVQKVLNNKGTTSNQGNSFEECFLKETNIDKIRSEGVRVLQETPANQSKPKPKKRVKFQDMLRLRRRRRKVTTVKVIAVKNRVAELYERIRTHQIKSQHILATNGFLPQEDGPESSDTAFMEQETQDATETYSTNDEDECNMLGAKTDASREIETKNVTRKIIGETLITLIPEGTKIPNTLPPSTGKLDNIDYSGTSKAVNYNSSFSKYIDSDERAECPACGKTFRSHFSLTIHKRIHYLETDSSVKLAHKCSDCDQLFNKLSQLKQHVESVHFPEGFVCKICNRKLTSLSLLERHMVRVHLDRPFNCQECGKNFSDALTYEKHIISHTSGEIYKCQVCGRKYSTEFFLLEHMRNHKEQIPQTCVVCGKVTLRITQHMKIHTPRPKRLLNCSVCGKVFNFSSGLSHHFKIMHKLPRPPPKPKKEPNLNVQKRKRKPRNTQKPSKKRNSQQQPIVLNEASLDNSGDIIEEPSEIPDEVYDEEDAQSMLDLRHHSVKLEDQQPANEDDDIAGRQESNLRHLMQHDHGHHHSVIDEEDVNHKEEEAKRVIVELIQNSSYTSLFPDNLPSVLEATPPIAREETISAVNSIVHNC